MFRSYYMTFTGDYRGGEGHDAHGDAHADGHKDDHKADDHGAHAAPAADAAKSGHDDHGAHAAPAADAAKSGHDDHGASAGHGHDDHGHGGVPHESPPAMTYVLMILAAAAFAAGFLFGLPSLWSGHEPVLEKFLAPSLPAAESVPFAHATHATEWLFQFFGLAIATVGWFFARMLYGDNRSQVPAQLKARFLGAWTVVYNKYYVDELYQATVVRGARLLAAVCYWIDQNLIDAIVVGMATIGKMVAYVDDAIDRKVVDGAVNGLASLTMGLGGRVRRLQTGHIQNYLFGALAGAIAFVVLQYVIR